MASSIAKVTEITARSDKSFEHAIEKGIERACKTLSGVTGAWVQDMKLDIKDGKITHYNVNMKVTFVLKD
jgi:flavin-binding protein dodecin